MGALGGTSRSQTLVSCLWARPSGPQGHREYHVYPLLEAFAWERGATLRPAAWNYLCEQRPRPAGTCHPGFCLCWPLPDGFPQPRASGSLLSRAIWGVDTSFPRGCRTQGRAQSPGGQGPAPG